jgi:hypothetical protein
LGRWTACDAIVPEGGLSLYVYVADNPLSFIDPDGEQLVCPKTGCSREQAQEVEKYWGQRQEALEKEYPDLKFAREHPTATAIIEGIQVVGAVIFIVQDIKSLTSGFSTPRRFTTFRSRPPPKSPAPPPPEPPAASAAPSLPAATMVGQETGPLIIIPKGASAPSPTRTAPTKAYPQGRETGHEYTGGKGAPYTDPEGKPVISSKVTSVRIMDPTQPSQDPKHPLPGYPTGHVTYQNGQGKVAQAVDPSTGQTVKPSDPKWHIPLGPYHP